MKLSTALCLLPSLALAAPSHKLDKRLPNLTPVNVENLDTEFDVKCGPSSIPYLIIFRLLMLNKIRQGHGQRTAGQPSRIMGCEPAALW